MKPCSLCKNTQVESLIEFGALPICNRFETADQPEPFRHNMAMGQCTHCGLVQLVDPVPASALLPPYEWITYNEPEGHLDELATILSSLPNLDTNAGICGISFKDDTTLHRLERLGFTNTWRWQTEEDLGIQEKAAGVETIQGRFSPEVAERMAQTHGRPHMIIARHVLEHAYDMHKLMAGFRALLAPNGYLVFEVPDCADTFTHNDYTTFWEEHLTYFTPTTFENAFPYFQTEIVKSISYPYPFENAMVAIVQFKDETPPPVPLSDKLTSELSRARKFADYFPAQRVATKSYLEKYRKAHGKIALFGGGHLACVYITALGLEDCIDFVVDDDPNKRGLLMPGSRIPILGSSQLLAQSVKLCLMSLSPESEKKVVAKNESFIDQGGRFASIIPASALALDLSQEPNL